MLRVHSFVFNPFQENTYVLYDETKECVIIDPGCFDPEEKSELAGFIEEQKLKVQILLNTHCHVDHVLGNYFVKEKYKVKLLIHKNDEPVLKAVTAYAPSYGLFQYDETEPDAFMEEGDIIRFGNQKLEVLFTPGHAPGHVVFYNEKEKILIGGDVLFYNSIGRTDLPGGSHDDLINSIHTKLFALPDNVKVYPGHGPETTIGFEKRTNPFCAISDVSS
jgi:hydroxyacylglutathione hydrolase